jgi:hypothetical protein
VRSEQIDYCVVRFPWLWRWRCAFLANLARPLYALSGTEVAAVLLVPA